MLNETRVSQEYSRFFNSKQFKPYGENMIINQEILKCH